MSELTTAKRFQFVAGNLALDFCNTVGGKRGVVEREYLDSFLELAAWAQQAQLLTTAQAEQALRIAGAHPAEATSVLSRATSLREALFRIFAAQLSGKRARESDLAILNAELSRSLGRLQLAAPMPRNGFAWTWSAEEVSLDQALGPVSYTAANLLADPSGLARVRMCHGDRCGWLFLDSSKNHSRCWCDMRDCGNRAKVRRHRQRQRRSRGQNL